MYVDPIFQARMPDPYYKPLNYGTNGVLPEAAGWNVNSAYLTPSFMAGYRPNYSGPQNMQMPYMGFWRGANTALPTPLQPDTPYYVDPRQYREHALSSSTNKAMDVAMTGAQLAAGIYISSFIGNLASRNLTGTSAGFGQMIRGQNAMGRVGAGVGRVAGGLAGSMTAGAGRIAGMISPWGGAAIAEGGAALGMAVMRGGAVLGGAIGGLAAPFAIGVGGAEMVDRAVFRPYLAGRQSADVMRTQYAGMAVGLGTAHSPLGVSNAEASRIGFSASSAFGGRLDFNDMTAPQIMQFGMQEGLYSKMSKVNAGTITARTKELAEQVKMVMDVFNEPSMQDAIKELGRLAHTGGVSGTGQVASLLGKYKLASAMTGISSRELAGTIGAQGQMMYGQAGLVPALGQASALASVTGINAAFRSGLVGADMMAMLGGQTGMVQGTQQGILGLAQSTYNKVMAYNQYALGGARGDITGNLNKMGAFIAADPLSAYGKFAMNANAAVSAQLRDSPFAPIQGTFQLLDNLPGAKNGKGQYKAEVIYSALLAQGLDPQSAESMLRTIQGYGAPGYQERLRESGRGVALSTQEKFLEQNGLLYSNSGIGKAYYNVRKTFADTSQFMGEKWGRFATDVGGLQDWGSAALMGISGATEATGLYQVDPSKEDFLTKKTRGVRKGVGRKVSAGGIVNWGQSGLGMGLMAGGAMMTGSLIGAVVGIPMMALGTTMAVAGALGHDEAATQQLNKLYSMADSDSTLKTILSNVRDGKTLAKGDQAYLMTQAGLTTQSDLDKLLSVVAGAEISEGKDVADSVETTGFEKAQRNFLKVLKQELVGNTEDLGGDVVVSRDMTGKAITRAGTRTNSLKASDKLGMEGAASLGKILHEITKGFYDNKGNRVGEGKGIVPPDAAIPGLLQTILAKNSSWTEKLKSAGINFRSDEGIAQLVAIGKAAMQDVVAVSSASGDINDPDFQRRYARNAAVFDRAGVPKFTASGGSMAGISQISANLDQMLSIGENAIASDKVRGIEGQVDFSAMISTIQSTTQTNKEAVDKFDLAVEKFRRPLTSEETIAKELAAKGKK